MLRDLIDNLEPYWQSDDGRIVLYCGKCEAVMRELTADFFRSIVTDPPYEISFMGAKWDGTGIAYSVPMWAEVLRVLRPGGHVLSFGGTRTYHRMACAIEDAGFEIRDMCQWNYATGFPKALDAAKAIDAQLKTPGEIVTEHDGTFGINKRRLELGHRPNDVKPGVSRKPGSAEAEQWQGWKTALKPANEPICLARKPLSEKNIAQNLLKWGTGCLNIDGCRIETEERLSFGSREIGDGIKYGKCKPTTDGIQNALGRYPSNVIIDEQVAAQLDDANPATTSAGGKSGHDGAYGGGYREDHYGDEKPGFGDKGGPSRYYFCAKASKAERNAGLEHLAARSKVFNGQSAEPSKDMKDVETRFTTQPSPNDHPTVKPIKLMRYLCRMVTPPDGVLLDPFCGSGSTLVAAVHEGFCAVGIDADEHSLEIAKGRIEHAIKERSKEKQLNLE